MSNVSLINGHIDGKQTNYDRIRNMSVEEIANGIYHRDEILLDKICKMSCKENGRCPVEDTVTSSDCINCVKRWLESEVTE